MFSKMNTLGHKLSCSFVSEYRLTAEGKQICKIDGAACKF